MMTLGFVDTLSIILIVTIATVVLLPVLCWVIAHKPSAA
jgi:hypothetical protein